MKANKIVWVLMTGILGISASACGGGGSTQTKASQRDAVINYLKDNSVLASYEDYTIRDSPSIVSGFTVTTQFFYDRNNNMFNAISTGIENKGTYSTSVAGGVVFDWGADPSTFTPMGYVTFTSGSVEYTSAYQFVGFTYENCPTLSDDYTINRLKYTFPTSYDDESGIKSSYLLMGMALEFANKVTTKGIGADYTIWNGTYSVPAKSVTPDSSAQQSSSSSMMQSSSSMAPTSSSTSFSSSSSSSSSSSISFGSYPQSRVTDTNTISTLNGLAGTLPSSGNDQSWTDYGYYDHGAISSYMWYQDVDNGGSKYRGVYFSSYRPWYCTGSASADLSRQDENGYSTFATYWFKYEPLEWRVLAVDGSKSFVMCESIIDSEQYYHKASGNTHSYNGSSVYENNYATSDIRLWLNNSFYGWAFSYEEQAKIATTAVDNSVASTVSSSNPYVSENTSDKVFLLSRQDITNTSYGFDSSFSASDNKRQLTNSDYAMCQGVYNDSGSGWWWLRSPRASYSADAGSVYFDGSADGYSTTYFCHYGVCPALWVSL